VHENAGLRPDEALRLQEVWTASFERKARNLLVVRPRVPDEVVLRLDVDEKLVRHDRRPFWRTLERLYEVSQ
jgi:hypothetical protein